MHGNHAKGARMKAIARKLGASYLWGLINFTIGVAAGSVVGTLTAMHTLLH